MFTSGTDITTAVTDLINALITLIPIIWLMKRRPRSLQHVLWAAGFFTFFLVSAAGFVMHGFTWQQSAIDHAWRYMYVLMAVMMASFVIVMYHEIKGGAHLKKAIVINAVLVALFSIASSILMERTSYGFTVFVAYCALNLVYMILLLIPHRNERACVRWFLAAIFILIVSNVLQTIKSIHFTLIWDFNYNAVYHFGLLIFVLVIFKGVRLAVADRDS